MGSKGNYFLTFVVINISGAVDGKRATVSDLLLCNFLFRITCVALGSCLVLARMLRYTNRLQIQ